MVIINNVVMSIHVQVFYGHVIFILLLIYIHGCIYTYTYEIISCMITLYLIFRGIA